MGRKRLEPPTCIAVRISADLKARLEAAAIASGRSLADEVLRRLERTFVVEKAFTWSGHRKAGADALNKREPETEPYYGNLCLD